MQRATFGKRNAPRSTGLSARANGSRRYSPILVALGIAVGFGAIAAGSATLFSPPPVTVASEEKLWVISQRVSRHTCPSITCGIVGELFYRESVTPIEVQGDWARVSKSYDASCTNGRSDYVDTGNDQCKRGNGIEDGQFSEWVEAAYLSPVRPADPAEGVTGLAKSVGQSDDFNLYQAQFVAGAQRLIDMGACTEAQLEESGGFLASMNLRPRKAYFVHCGLEKFYVDVTTLEIFR